MFFLWLVEGAVDMPPDRAGVYLGRRGCVKLGRFEYGVSAIKEDARMEKEKG